MSSIFGGELTPASLADPGGSLHPVFPAAMGIESRSAIRADDPQILDPVVLRRPVDVIEDQRHAAATPVFVLAAHLTNTLLHTHLEEPLLDLAPRVGRSADKDLGQRPWRAMEVSRRSRSRIEVVGRDLPNLVYVFLQQSVITTRRPHAKTTQHLAVRLRHGNRLTCLVLGVPRHIRTLVRISDERLLRRLAVMSQANPGWCNWLARLVLVQEAVGFESSPRNS